VDGRALVAALQLAVKALPTTSEKQELRRSINDLIAFLTDLRDSLRGYQRMSGDDGAGGGSNAGRLGDSPPSTTGNPSGTGRGNPPAGGGKK
jgi:hypothetical protein